MGEVQKFEIGCCKWLSVMGKDALGITLGWKER